MHVLMRLERISCQWWCGCVRTEPTVVIDLTLAYHFLFVSFGWKSDVFAISFISGTSFSRQHQKTWGVLVSCRLSCHPFVYLEAAYRLWWNVLKSYWSRFGQSYNIAIFVTMVAQITVDIFCDTKTTEEIAPIFCVVFVQLANIQLAITDEPRFVDLFFMQIRSAPVCRVRYNGNGNVWESLGARSDPRLP